MLLTLIQKEMMHHILSVRFVATPRDVSSAPCRLPCISITAITSQNQVNYQAAIELSTAEVDDALHWLRDPPAPDTEIL